MLSHHPTYAVRPMPADTSERVGGALKAFIARSGKTQRKLADEIGADPTYVSQMVNDRVNWINSQYFGRIVAALGIRPDEVRRINPAYVIEFSENETPAPTPLPALPSGRFVPSSRLSLYGQPEGMTYVPNEIDRPQVEAVLLDSHGMEAGGMLYGATLYVDPAERTPEAGRVYLIEHDGRYDVRRAAAHGTEVWYYADSPAQGGPPLQAGRVRVVGRVFKFVNPPHDA